MHISLALPLIAMAWLAVSGILERQKFVSEMDHLQEMTVLSQYDGDLAHEFQRWFLKTCAEASHDVLSFSYFSPELTAINITITNSHSHKHISVFCDTNGQASHSI